MWCGIVISHVMKKAASRSALVNELKDEMCTLLDDIDLFFLTVSVQETLSPLHTSTELFDELTATEAIKRFQDSNMIYVIVTCFKGQGLNSRNRPVFALVGLFVLNCLFFAWFFE